MTNGKRRACSWAALVVLVMGFWVGLESEAHAAGPALEGVPELRLVYGEGDAVHRPAMAERGALRVYWFWSAVSHCSRRAEPGLQALLEAYPEVEVVVVHSNADESAAQAREVAMERGLMVAIYRDEGARLAIALDARMTPEVVVVDHEQVIYKGRPVATRGKEIQSYVEAAIASWERGESIEPAFRRPTGCPIRRP